MEAFLVSTGLVALGEIGDKTQLLALCLSARYRKPVPILLGILVATIANHALAGAVGELVRGLLDPEALQWVLGASFIAFAVWALIPDRFEGCQAPARSALGVFASTSWIFFIAEMGDKTQLATMMLAARYGEALAVVFGSTLGMMLANAPVVLLAASIVPRIPMHWVRRGAAGVFAAMGVGMIARVLA